MLERGQLEYSGAEADTIFLLEKYAALRQPPVISSVCECKVCGKPFGDRLSLYDHYDEEHNKQTDL
jgi:hypothetical protein